MVGEENKGKSFGGWNGSRIKNGSQQSSVLKKKSEKKTVNRWFVIGGLLGVLAALIVLVGSFLEKDESPAEPPKTKVIKQDVKPIQVRPIKDTTEFKQEELITNRQGHVVKKVEEKTYVDEKGILRYEGGARVYRNKENRKPVKVMQNDPFPKLKHRSDYEIATLITVRPGGMLFGQVEYDDKFKESFINSLTARNEPVEGDSEWDIELKAAIEETKKELLQRIKDGEDLGDILREAREESRRLASYKREIQSLIRESLGDENATENDVKDVIKAANQMLEEKGIEPFKEDAFLRSRMRILSVESQKKSTK
jgi:hypothetical protein